MGCPSVPPSTSATTRKWQVLKSRTSKQAFPGRQRKAIQSRAAAFTLPAALLAAMTQTVPAFAAQNAVEACQAEQSTSTASLAMARRCKVPVAVTESITETDRVIANPDGTATFEHRYRPVRVKRSGHWVPVDTTLERRADGSIAPRAAAVDISFSAGGDVAMVTVANQAASLSLGSPVGDLPAPALAGNTATYREVLPGVDLQLRADVDGYSQVFVVKSAKAAANPSTAAAVREVTSDPAGTRTATA